MPDRRPHARLIPELYVDDLQRSLRFYRDVLGFEVLYERPEELFAFLDREGAQLMMQAQASSSRRLLAGEPGHPYGRGIHFQIEVSDVLSLYDRVRRHGAELLLPLEERWYRVDEVELGNRQFVVLDPDGYVLRFFQDMGER